MGSSAPGRLSERVSNGGRARGATKQDRTRGSSSRRAWLTSPKRELGIAGHGVRLVQNDQLDTRGKELLCASKALDLVTDNADAAVVGGVEDQGHRFPAFLAVQALGASQDGAGFPGAGGPVEEQVGKLAVVDEAVDCARRGGWQGRACDGHWLRGVQVAAPHRSAAPGATTAACSLVPRMSLCAMRSSMVAGRYFSTQGSVSLRTCTAARAGARRTRNGHGRDGKSFSQVAAKIALAARGGPRGRGLRRLEHAALEKLKLAHGETSGRSSSTGAEATAPAALAAAAADELAIGHRDVCVPASGGY